VTGGIPPFYLSMGFRVVPVGADPSGGASGSLAKGGSSQVGIAESDGEPILKI
jgi:hypothetical protein